jgi:hypothetical protein
VLVLLARCLRPVRQRVSMRAVVARLRSLLGVAVKPPTGHLTYTQANEVGGGGIRERLRGCVTQMFDGCSFHEQAKRLATEAELLRIEDTLSDSLCGAAEGGCRLSGRVGACVSGNVSSQQAEASRAGDELRIAHLLLDKAQCLKDVQVC